MHNFTISAFRLHNRWGFLSLDVIYTQKKHKNLNLSPIQVSSQDLSCPVNSKQHCPNGGWRGGYQVLTKNTQNNAFINDIISFALSCELCKPGAINHRP